MRHDMADLIEMAASRGQPITMEQAYNKACALNPQVSAVLEDRKQKAELMARQTTLAEKKAASTSIVGHKGGAGGVSGGGSLRGDLLAAMDEANE